MDLFWMLAFLCMLPVALVTVAIAAKRPSALIWNYIWFFIFAKVGLLAFASVWGGYPGILCAIWYTSRVINNRSAITSHFSLRFPTKAARSSVFQERPVPDEDGVIDAEFRREPSKKSERLEGPQD